MEGQITIFLKLFPFIIDRLDRLHDIPWMGICHLPHGCFLLEVRNERQLSCEETVATVGYDSHLSLKTYVVRKDEKRIRGIGSWISSKGFLAFILSRSCKRVPWVATKYCVMCSSSLFNHHVYSCRTVTPVGALIDTSVPECLQYPLRSKL